MGSASLADPTEESEGVDQLENERTRGVLSGKREFLLTQQKSRTVMTSSKTSERSSLYSLINARCRQLFGSSLMSRKRQWRIR